VNVLLIDNAAAVMTNTAVLTDSNNNEPFYILDFPVGCWRLGS
jgi:hypothetical protein